MACLCQWFDVFVFSCIVVWRVSVRGLACLCPGISWFGVFVSVVWRVCVRVSCGLALDMVRLWLRYGYIWLFMVRLWLGYG